MIDLMSIKCGAVLMVAAGTHSNRFAYLVRVDEVEAVDEAGIRFVGAKVTLHGRPVFEHWAGLRVEAVRSVIARPDQLSPFTVTALAGK